MESHELLSAIFNLQIEATKVALIQLGSLSATVTQAEAWRIYTRRKVERWEKKGALIAQPRTGPNAAKEYKREDLIRLSILGEGNIKRLPVSR